MRKVIYNCDFCREEIKDPFVLDWYNYLHQLTNIAREYRTTHKGMWAKTLLEFIFEGDYEDAN